MANKKNGGADDDVVRLLSTEPYDIQLTTNRMDPSISTSWRERRFPERAHLLRIPQAMSDLRVFPKPANPRRTLAPYPRLGFDYLCQGFSIFRASSRLPEYL